MDFPVFINKWVIGFKPIQRTPFWFWFRLVNHSNWRMDDHHRYWDFWHSLSHGWEHMEYVNEFEKYWGKGSYPPERIFLKPGDFDALVERLSLPSEETMESIKRIMNRKAPWDDE